MFFCTMAINVGLATSLYDCFSRLNVVRPGQICLNADEQNVDNPVFNSCLHLNEFNLVLNRISNAFFRDGIASLVPAPCPRDTPATAAPSTAAPPSTTCTPCPAPSSSTSAIAAPSAAAPPARDRPLISPWIESSDPLAHFLAAIGCDEAMSILYWITPFVLYVLHCGITSVILFLLRACSPRLRKRYPAPRWGLVTFGGTLGLALDSAINARRPRPYRSPSVTNADTSDDDIWLPMNRRISEASPEETVTFRGGPEPRVHFGNLF